MAVQDCRSYDSVCKHVFNSSTTSYPMLLQIKYTRIYSLNDIVVTALVPHEPMLALKDFAPLNTDRSSTSNCSGSSSSREVRSVSVFLTLHATKNRILPECKG